MSCDPKYIGYNDLKVTLCDKLEVSKVNTLGLPPPDCGAYLQSLKINSAVASQGNNGDSIGCTGDFTLIDYKHHVLNTLIEHYNANAKGGNPFCPVKIELNCFTGPKLFEGNVEEWGWSFSGAVATINVKWKQLTPSSAPKEPLPPGTFLKPSQLISYVIGKLGIDQPLEFKFIDGTNEISGSNIDGALKFIGDKLTFTPEHLPNTGNVLIDIYIYVCNNVTASDGSPVVGTISEDGKYYKVVKSGPANGDARKTVETDTISELVFVQNGNQTPYVTNSSGKISIPMTSFSIDLDLKCLPTSNSITKTKNGTFVAGNQSSGTAVDAEKANVQSKGKAKTDGNCMEVSFSCYNVACFACNNSNARISIVVYDEDGIEIDFLKLDNLIAQSVTYDLSGPVIKADVKCTAKIGKDDKSGDSDNKQAAAPALNAADVSKDNTYKGGDGAPAPNS